LPIAALVVAFVWVPAGSFAPVIGSLQPEPFQRAMLVVLFSLQGFEIVAVPAGHARNSRWSVPIATVASLVLATLIYVSIHAACVWSLPDLPDAEAPLIEAGRVLGGPRLESVMAVGTNLSAFGIALGMLAMSPRYLAALGRADALGEWLSREDARRVPQHALWITVVSVLIFSQWKGLGELFALSSVSVLAQYGVTAAALATLALRQSHGLRRWHVLPVPFALAAILLIAQGARTSELLVAAAVLAAGVGVLAARRRGLLGKPPSGRQP
jgi:amino acid transporter